MSICQRCKEEGTDRRTLWMACFYDMSEMDVPFKDAQIKGKFMAQSGIRVNMFGQVVQDFKDDPNAEEQQRHFYTLRVCKTCRADWMKHIEDWFKFIDLQEEGVAGAYIRDKGGMRLMTQEEIDERESQGLPVYRWPTTVTGGGDEGEAC